MQKLYMLTFLGSFCLFLTKLICLFVDSAHRRFGDLID